MSPRPYPASLASLVNPQSHKPPGQYLKSGPGGHLAFQGPRAYPLSLGWFGNKWHIWAIKAPFGPISMRQRREDQWAHLSLFWPKAQETKNDQNPKEPQIGPRTQDTQIGHK
ncbi:hypothetical protein O181_003170 [Austropuccinia psidii MF-1]|uniref:Uncharacterized protein n=1 Tax=Austropuccinia psidii MF-1 TaxID=1389203 RepID=A0A9Q3BEG2_9BASI|nr:hypothetical protein [Austropuccinia psidii MF-1]